jgi:hypothetical protein
LTRRRQPSSSEGIRNVCRRFVQLCRELKLFTQAIVANQDYVRSRRSYYLQVLAYNLKRVISLPDVTKPIAAMKLLAV